MHLLQKYWHLSFSNRWYRMAAHIIFWLLLLFWATGESVTVRVNFQQHAWVSFTGILLATFLFYPLVYVIIPLFQKGKWVLAFLFCIVYYLTAIILRTYHLSIFISWNNLKTTSVSGGDFWHNVLHRQLSPYALLHYFFSSVTGMLNIIFIPLVIKFIRYAYRFHNNITRVEKEKNKQELDFLKTQLNPHLLFNTLNNLQSLIVHDEKQRSVNLIGSLSAFLRFSLYEASHEFISIDKEIWLIENYITIERFRYEETAVIRFDKEVSSGSTGIPPLLLLPMVENAFKHSGDLPSGEINIRVHLQAGMDKMNFSVHNNYDKKSTWRANDGTAGIGLSTLQKRLDFYYPGLHSITAKDSGESYQIELTIIFNKL